MPLYRVTLTGADDTVDPVKLIELSKEFPFVEWGILIGSQTGHRFPSNGWIFSLVEERMKAGNLPKLALHVCGKFMRAIDSGNGALLRDFLVWRLAAFDRVQLNVYGHKQNSEASENILNAFCAMLGPEYDPEIIFQLDNVNNNLFLAPMRRFRCTGLFDASGGAGVVPTEWPDAHPILATGWAGGLGPDNVVNELKIISQKANPVHDFWIDMETKLYDEDLNFSLAKCRQVLEAVKPFVCV